MQDDLIKAIKEKYESIGEDPDAYLKGLLHARQINYWDYIEVDTLLSLQKPRTNFKDEEIFIMYHQVIELVLKLIVHELKQITGDAQPDMAAITEKMKRVTRYTEMLITTFAVMREGMDYDDYNEFRFTLTPASGFQSAQFRYIELYCTGLHNLVNEAGRERLPENPSIDDYFEHIYWRDAGLNRKTGKKTLTLKQFESKYLDDFKALAGKMKGKTLEDKLLAMSVSADEKTIASLREFDYFYNVKWPMTHLETARYYLDKKGEEKAATGGSDWKRYLHPKFQQRKFFPALWSEEEINHWGEEK